MFHKRRILACLDIFNVSQPALVSYGVYIQQHDYRCTLTMFISTRGEHLWLETGVCYQILSRPYRDANGDGVRDIREINDTVDYLMELDTDNHPATTHGRLRLGSKLKLGGIVNHLSVASRSHFGYYS